jgi:hypothetical protein
LALLASLCFSALALNNVLLLVDFVVTPTLDLALARSVVALVGTVLLVAGLVLEDS